jgi:transcriptional regulator with XRE-family HTH domain
MNEGKELKRYLEQNDISLTEIAEVIDLNYYKFRREIAKPVVSDDLKQKLKLVNIVINGKSVYGSYEKKKNAEYSQYSAEWLNKSVRSLIAQGIIDKKLDVAKELKFQKGNVSHYLNGSITPSKAFIDAFLKRYEKYLEDEILVALKNGKQAKIVLPKGYGKDEIETVIKVLKAYA